VLNFRWFDPARAAALALALGLTLSGAGAWWVHSSAEAKAQRAFDRLVDQAGSDVLQSLGEARHALRSAEAVYQATRSFDPLQFRAFAQSLSLPSNHVGVLAVGLISRVPRTVAAEFQAARRAEGQGTYRLHAACAASADALLAVRQVEPLAGKPALLGMDFGCHPALRQGIDAAIDAGASRFMLTPDESVSAAMGLHGPGLLLVMPLFQPDRPVASAEQRRAALVGLLFATVDASVALRGLQAEHAERVTLSVSAQPAAAGAAGPLLVALQAAATGAARGRFQAQRTLDLLGLTLRLDSTSTPAFEATLGGAATWAVLASGLLATTLAALFARGLATGRERAEAETRQATAEVDRLAMVVRATSNAVVITDAARRITWVNHGFERLTGFSLAEARGQSPGAMLQCDGSDAGTIGRLRVALNGGQRFECELLNRSKSGREYWVALEIQPLVDASGVHTGFMAIETDVTERRLAEQGLRASQDLLDQTGRIGGVGGFALQFEGMQMQWTAQTCRLLGVEAEHPPSLQEFFNFCAPEGRGTLLKAIDAGTDGGMSWDLELPLINANGRPMWVRLVAEIAFNDRGPVRLVGTLHDITERRRMLAEVQRSAALMRGAFETIDEPFVLFGPDDRLVFCNDKYREIYAASAELIFPGARFEDIVRGGAERGQYPDAEGRIEEWMAERVAAHRSGDATLIQRVAGGRTIRIVERRMPDGHTVGFRIDITDLIRATEAAEAANLAKSEFIGTISHELRTPLQSIIGFSELGRHFAREQPRFESMFADIHAGGRRMLTLVNGLLDVSKIEGTQNSLAVRRMALEPLLKAVAGELRTQLAQRGLRVLLPAETPARYADLDEFRFQQVVRNLLANAIRFSPAGASIEIGLAAGPDGGTDVTFRDHGPGIPPDEVESIFEPFVQSSRTRDGAGGTGLGLTICRRIMRAHGGSIEACNAPGGGALMRLRLPGSASNASAAPAEPAAASERAAAALSV